MGAERAESISSLVKEFFMCFSSGFDSRRPYKKALAVTRCAACK